jgi:hypothetical protein
MTTNLAGAAANCSTGTWAQKWKCAWNQPAPGVAHAGTGFGHNLLPALVVLAVVILIARSVTRRRKARGAAPAGAAARR